MARGTPAPIPVRRRLDPDARRTQLIELGVELIKSRPFDQLLIDEVIAAAGISKGLLFHYFSSKRDFQVAVIRAAAADLLSHLRPNDGLGPLEQLRHGLEAYVAYIEQQPSTYTAIVRGAGSDAALLAVFEETRDEIVELIVGRIDGEPTPLLRLGVRGWIAAVEEATILWLRDRPCARDDLIDLLYQAALQIMPLAAAAQVPSAE